MSAHAGSHQEWGALGEAGRRWLDRACVRFRCAAGDSLFREGAPCTGMYCLHSGLVAVRKRDGRGHAAIVRIVDPGRCFGHRAFFEGTAYTASALALSDCEGCLVERADMAKLLEQHPKLATRFLQRVSEELRDAEEAGLSLMYQPVRARLAKLLLTLKDLIGVANESGEVRVDLPFSREMLAELLGTRRETVFRAMRALAQGGVVTFHERQVVIPDLDGLLDEAEGVPSTLRDGSVAR